VVGGSLTLGDASTDGAEAPLRHPLHWSLLRVRGNDGQVVGAGFLAAEGWVCTCAHVVAEALGRDDTSSVKPDESVRLERYVDGTEVIATVDRWIPAREHSDDGPPAPSDIALLAVQAGDRREASGHPARLLAPSRLTGHPYVACGFPGGEPEGAWDRGVFGQARNETVQIESTSGVSVRPGFSGAPVWDEHERAVVGMVVSSWRDAHTGVAFVIPVYVLAAATGGHLRVGHSGGRYSPGV
jgi:hypothetical protein